MTVSISESEAQFALSSIERRRQQVVAEINMPTWYWFLLAAGWVLLGVLADFGSAWATIVATLLFGAVHAGISPRVLSGRRASPQLSIRGDLVSLRLPVLVIGCLLVMTAATVGVALVLHADGARHAATWASVVVALLVLVGGPTLVSSVRHRAELKYRLTWPRPSSMSSSIQVPDCRSSPCWHRPIGPSSPS